MGSGLDLQYCIIALISGYRSEISPPVYSVILLYFSVLYLVYYYYISMLIVQ